MGRPAGLFDVEERLAGLSKRGDALERLAAVVDFELFRQEFERAVPRVDRSKALAAGTASPSPRPTKRIQISRSRR